MADPMDMMVGLQKGAQNKNKTKMEQPPTLAGSPVQPGG
jgi:hypothetical protein